MGAGEFEEGEVKMSEAERIVADYSNLIDRAAQIAGAYPFEYIVPELDAGDDVAPVLLAFREGKFYLTWAMTEYESSSVDMVEVEIDSATLRLSSEHFAQYLDQQRAKKRAEETAEAAADQARRDDLAKLKASPEYATYLELAKRFSGLSR